MPKLDSRNRRWPALLGGAALALLAVGIGVAVMRPEPPVATAPSTSSATAPAAPKTPLLSAAQWTDLQSALADHPQRDAETARIVEILAFQKAVRDFGAQRLAGATPQTLAEAASRLDAELLLHLERREMTGPEAMQLKAKLLEVLEPDATRRAETLAAWRDAQLQAHPPATDPRDTAFLQAQAELVAQWRATAPAGAPPDQLIAELEALRQRTYVARSKSPTPGDKP